MANVNTPSGLVPVSYMDGNKWSGQGTQCYIASNDSNAYAIGDPVTLVSGGADAAGIPGITLATAGTGNVVLGVIVGYAGQTYGGAYVTPSQLDTAVIPASKTRAYYPLVCTDPNVIYEIQEAYTTSGAVLTVTSVGKNANLKAGTNNGYVSGWVMDNTGTATTSTLQLNILRVSQRIDNSIGQYCKWLVRINNHQFNAGVAGV